jgi:hypothetical protein
LRHRTVVAGLVAAGSLVAVENAVFFLGERDTPLPADAHATETGDPGPQESEEASARLSPVSVADLDAYLKELPEGSRNPFLTRLEAEQTGGGPAVGSPRAPLPLLSGTLSSEQRRVAWIDGSPHAEGDAVGDYRLERIERGSIVLRGHGETQRVPLPAPTEDTHVAKEPAEPMPDAGAAP